MSGGLWRKRMQDLSRNVGRPHAPLFAPLLFGVAAQIEAIEPRAMARDATRLRKNVTELRRALGLDAVVCAVPSAMEAEALGVPIDDSTWPPRPAGALQSALSEEVDAPRLIVNPRIAASLDAVRQWQADASEPVIVAALTGPATLHAQLCAAGSTLGDEAGYEFAGRVLGSLARTYCELGVQVVALHESLLPQADDEIDFWMGALNTVGNVARFHRVPPLLVIDGQAPAAWPVQAVACPTPAQHAGAMPRAHGRAWAAMPTDWAPLPGEGANERLVTTVAEVPADTPVAELVAHVARIRPS
ncbi:MAG: hypothetical protein OJF60_000507 [Burkholderiaceae bacterium]|nr:MAG: hypothetical protein OJF60_000507 [Burkholderiaceae bacterium]